MLRQLAFSVSCPMQNHPTSATMWGRRCHRTYHPTELLRPTLLWPKPTLRSVMPLSKQWQLVRQTMAHTPRGSLSWRPSCKLTSCGLWRQVCLPAPQLYSYRTTLYLCVSGARISSEGGLTWLIPCSLLHGHGGEQGCTARGQLSCPRALCPRALPRSLPGPSIGQPCH